MHGDQYDYIITDDIDGAIADGWHLTTTEAKAASTSKSNKSDDDHAPPTRAELEQKAHELKIKFDTRTTDKKLHSLITDAIGK